MHNQQVNTSSNSASIYFTGLNKNIKIAKKAINEFHDEFGRPSSDSFIKLKIYQHNGDKNYAIISKKLKNIAKKYADKMLDTYYVDYIIERANVIMNKNDTLKQTFIKKLESNVKEFKVANCDAYSDILCNKLRKKGVKAKIVNFYIKNKNTRQIRECGTHSTVVIDMKDKAKINKLKTWGEDAVIIDAWADIHASAETGVKYLQECFNFNPKTEYIEYVDIEKLGKKSLFNKLLTFIISKSL